MKTVYLSTSKGGREFENGPFTTKERADADVFANCYYLPEVVEDSVSDEEFEALEQDELRQDQESKLWMDETNLEKYRDYLKGVA